MQPHQTFLAFLFHFGPSALLGTFLLLLRSAANVCFQIQLAQRRPFDRTRRTAAYQHIRLGGRRAEPQLVCQVSAPGLGLSGLDCAAFSARLPPVRCTPEPCAWLGAMQHSAGALGRRVCPLVSHRLGTFEPSALA
jgi:hypothetical protein